MYEEEEIEGFYEAEPEDYFALEELYYGSMAKCRGGGRGKRRDKFEVKEVSEGGSDRE